jgi:hypothetical protein
MQVNFYKSNISGAGPKGPDFPHFTFRHRRNQPEKIFLPRPRHISRRRLCTTSRMTMKHPDNFTPALPHILLQLQNQSRIDFEMTPTVDSNIFAWVDGRYIELIPNRLTRQQGAGFFGEALFRPCL